MSFGPAAFRAATGVSRETLARLETHAALLGRWQPRINLIAPKTVPEIWWRHIYDSAQLVPLLPPDARSIVDLGSGGGFPGLVLAIMTGLPTTLIDADSRKAAFLREVSRETSATVTIRCQRLEAAPPSRGDVVTARALAPLPRLLGLAAPYGTETATFLLLKGQDVGRELTDARKSWTFTADRVPSRTSPDSTILRLQGLVRCPTPRPPPATPSPG